MAGHSKFANTQHRKNAQDSKKTSRFNKIIRRIHSAVKGGSPDPDMNPKLRLAISEAQRALITKDKINNAIQVAHSGLSADNLEYIRYNGTVAGIAFIVEASTNNKSRTASDVRAVFNKHNGLMTERGSVEFLFDHIGLICYESHKGEECEINEDDIMEKAIEMDCIDCELEEDDCFYIQTQPTDLHAVTEKMIAIYKDPKSAVLSWEPKARIDVDDALRERIEKVLDALEDLDDVENVYTNHE